MSRPSPSEPVLAAGTRFGTYRVERLIGTGGMGSVYEATHVGLKKRVALKILHQSFVANDEVIARFLREGEATARINHPNVVDVTDLGVKDGLPYLVMELLVGESLSDVLAREKILPVERAVDVLLPIISAVGMAHDEGVVHRDLKPDNIFLSKNRLGLVESKLLDFGISKMTTRSELTTAAAVMGTPHYLSPEQAQALRDIDGRSDQYSISVILYRLVTGVLPVNAETVMDVLLAVARGQVRPPRQAKFDLPENLERILMRGLATLPKDRYPHIHLMGCELLRFASEEGRAAWRGHFEMRWEQLGAGPLTVVSRAPVPSAPGLGAMAPLLPGPQPLFAGTPALGTAMPMMGGPMGSAPSMPAMAPMPSGGHISAVPHPSGAPRVTPHPPPPVISRSAMPPVHSAPPPSKPATTPAPSVGRSPAPSGGSQSPRSAPLSASISISPVTARARDDDEDATLRGINPDSMAGDAVMHGARWPMGVLGMALLLAVAAVAGGLWVVSRKDAPVAIPVSSGRPVASYRVAVAVEPSDAEVLIDGAVKGRGALDVELPADGAEHVFEARAPGHVPVRLTFRQGSVPPDRVRLERE